MSWWKSLFGKKDQLVNPEAPPVRAEPPPPPAEPVAARAEPVAVRVEPIPPRAEPLPPPVDFAPRPEHPKPKKKLKKVERADEEAREQADTFLPRMPRVDVPIDLDQRLSSAWRLVDNQINPEPDPEQRRLAIITPGRMLMAKHSPHPESASEAYLDAARKLVHSKEPRRIVAIAFNDLKALMTDTRRAIPFLDQLLGLAYLGHKVVVFEGHPSALEVVLHGVDTLLVDRGMLPHLPSDWLELAHRALRAPDIQILERDGRVTRLGRAA